MPRLPTFDPIPGLPGPPPARFLGRAGNLARLVDDPIAYLGDLHRRYGKVAAITHNDPAVVSALGPEHNQLILSDAKLFTTIDDGGFDSSDRVPKDSALSTMVKDLAWKRRMQLVKMVVPTMHPQHALPGYVEAMVTSVLRVIDRWRVGEQIDVPAQIQQITFRVAMTTLLGLDPDVHDGERLRKQFRAWVRLVFLSSMSTRPALAHPVRFAQLMRLSNQLMATCRRTVALKRKDPGNDALSRLILAEDPEAGKMTEDELIFSAHTLFIFGNLSVPNVLSWALFLLSQHPGWLEQVQEELEGVLQGAPPTFAKLGELKLLHWTVNETLRLMPAAVYQKRIAQDRFALGPFEMPKGSGVIWNTFFSHRSPTAFSDPERFVPQRWETARPSPFEYLPFGYGAHGCVGMHFGTTEIKVALALVLQRFRLALAPHARIDYRVDGNLRPTALPMIVLDRQTRFTATRPEGQVHSLVRLTDG